MAAGLNWEVGLQNLYTAKEGGLVNQEVPAMATIRMTDNRVLGVVGTRFRPLQNVEAFKTFQPFLDGGQATFESAGSLFEGSRVWVLAKINRPNSVIVKGDEVAKYIVLSHAHDGSLSIHYGLTPIRVVCANTEAMMRGNEGSQLLKIRHTESARDTLAAAAELINIADARFEATMEQYRTLARKVANPAKLAAYFRIVSDLPAVPEVGEVVSTRRLNHIARLNELFVGGQGNDLPGVRGTWWAAYNAVSEFLSHEHGFSDGSRLNGVWFGKASNDNGHALETALRLAA